MSVCIQGIYCDKMLIYKNHVIQFTVSLTVDHINTYNLLIFLCSIIISSNSAQRWQCPKWMTATFITTRLASRLVINFATLSAFRNLSSPFRVMRVHSDMNQVPLAKKQSATSGSRENARDHTAIFVTWMLL